MVFRNLVWNALIRLRLMSVLLRLHGAGNNALPESLSKVFREIIIGKKSRKEVELLDRIESLRRKLNRSQDRIEILSGYNAPEEEYGHLRTRSRTIGYVSKTSSTLECWALVLFKLIRGLRPANCFEMGTCVGISAAYQGAALKLNQSGQLTTFELSQSKVDIARTVFHDLQLDNIETVTGKFQDTMENELKKKQPVDYVFIDGHHDEKATINYFELLSPYLADKAIVIFDDIDWSAGMKNAWNVLRRDRRFSVAIDLMRIGICIFKKPADNTLHPPG